MHIHYISSKTMSTNLTLRRIYFKSHFKIKSVFVNSVNQTRCISSKLEPNVIKSKIPDINIPRISLNEFVWRNLDKWHDKTALVSNRNI